MVVCRVKTKSFVLHDIFLLFCLSSPQLLTLLLISLFNKCRLHQKTSSGLCKERYRLVTPFMIHLRVFFIYNVFLSFYCKQKGRLGGTIWVRRFFKKFFRSDFKTSCFFSDLYFFFVQSAFKVWL